MPGSTALRAGIGSGWSGGSGRGSGGIEDIAPGGQPGGMRQQVVKGDAGWIGGLAAHRRPAWGADFGVRVLPAIERTRAGCAKFRYDLHQRIVQPDTVFAHQRQETRVVVNNLLTDARSKSESGCDGIRARVGIDPAPGGVQGDCARWMTVSASAGKVSPRCAE